MLAALRVRERQLGEVHATERGWQKVQWRQDFEKELLEVLPEAEVVGRNAPRLWNTVMALAPEADCRQRWVVKLDKLGFAVSTGSACASGKEEPSHVLRAMGYQLAEAGRALRFSSGWETTAQDWHALCEALGEVHRSAKASPLAQGQVACEL
jgi:cysteine desulfurase